MIRMSRKAKKAMAVALTAGMLASTAVTPVMAATKGWKQNSKGWWYQNADGSYPANKWSQINGVWYYFDANGYMLENAWVKDSKGDWYYVGSNGAMKTNAWQKTDGVWYWLKDNGAMFEGGWARINGEWYFFNADGVMQTGVITVDGKTYYLDAEDGDMKEGEIELGGTKYTFAEKDGYCTNEVAPATDKNFDAKGNIVEAVVEVEKVAGITGEITNAMTEYSDENTKVVLAGKKAYLKVLVTGKDGKPVANTTVSLDMEYVKKAEGVDAFASRGLEVVQTDEYGYANFEIAPSKAYEDKYKAGDKITETSGEYALYEITATATATNQKYKTNLAFATLSLGEVEVKTAPKDIIQSANAEGKNTDKVETTYTIDGKAETEYVPSQQVSTKGTEEHKITFAINPTLKIPNKDEVREISDYKQDINKTIPEYSVYEDHQIEVKDVPAGLKYATLNFESVDISEYTKVYILTYPAGKRTGLLSEYAISGPHTQKNFAYQIPVQQDTAVDVVVKLVSEGQVNDDQNGGVVVKDIYGVYDHNKSASSTKDIVLKDAVTWTIEDVQYSNEMLFDKDPEKNAAEAKKYIGAEKDAKYTAPGNKYTYQVPAYPASGNAIMTVKDENNKVVGYFTIPTVNYNENGWYRKGANGFQNENVLEAADGQAILVSKDEAFNKVGSIKQIGNAVEVNSEETGITTLQAKISIDDVLTEELNITNNTVKTSVHWSPIKNVEEKEDIEKQDFYALVGQNITVKAQLVDKNGNKVSQAGKTIFYKYGATDENATLLKGLGAIGDTKATATTYTATTDANGQATIKVTSGDESALVSLLHAECEDFNVQLLIGDTKVSYANLHWVDANLAFTDSVEGTTFDTVGGNSEVVSDTLKKDVGTNWIFGYKVLGNTTVADKKDVKIGVEGLKIDVSKGGAGDIVTTGMKNGVAKVTSTKAGATTLTGAINASSVVSGTDVVFTINNSSYKNVGEGVPSINSALNLPITWGNVGTQIEVIDPKGSSIVVDGKDCVYVRVTDSFGNEIKDKYVEISVTYSDGYTTKKAKYSGDPVDIENTADVDKDGLVDILEKETDGDGLVKVILPEAFGEFKPLYATISAKVGNETAQKTINYKADPEEAVEFAIGDIVYEAQSATSNPKVRVIFTTPVNKSTLNADMFTIKKLGGDKDYEIPVAKVEVDPAHSNEVIITIDNQYANGLTNETEYEVTIEPKTIKGIEYTLCDSYFRTFKGIVEKEGKFVTEGAEGYTFDGLNDAVTEVTNKFTTADSKIDDAREAVEKAVDAVKAQIKEDAEIAADNKAIKTDVAAVKKAVAVEDEDATSIDLSKVANSGSTVTVTVADANNKIITAANGVITVKLGNEVKGERATFTVAVSKGKGETDSKTYVIVVSDDGKTYTIRDKATQDQLDADEAAAALKEAKEKAQTALNTAVAELGDLIATNVEANKTVTFAAVEGSSITSVEVADGLKSIFANNSTDLTKLTTVAGWDAEGLSGTVTVVYTNNTAEYNGEVKATVVYDVVVTAAVGNGGGGEPTPGTITFTKKTAQS